MTDQTDITAEVITSEVVAALNNLDHANDDHWTADGVPRVDAVRALVHERVADKVTREVIVNAAPEFARVVPDQSGDAEQGSGAGAESTGSTDAAPPASGDVSPGEAEAAAPPAAPAPAAPPADPQVDDSPPEATDGMLERDRAAADVERLELEHQALLGVVAEHQKVADAKEKELVAARDVLHGLGKHSEADEMKAWMAAQARQRSDRRTESVRFLDPADAGKTPIERALESRPRQVPGGEARKPPPSEAR